MKQRFYIIVFSLILISIIIIAAAASSSSPKKQPDDVIMPTPTPGPVVMEFTITSGVGAEKIIMTNLNTAATFTLTQGDFPATFHCNDGDVLTFNVISKAEYTFNAWFLDDGTWQSKNPLTMKTDGSFSMEALFLINDVDVINP